MEIHKLKVTNFKSFEELEIEFDNIKGLYLIKGDIGSGKTTIAEALLFAIYGTINGKKNGDLIRWGQKHGTTDIEFRVGANNISIHRELNSYGQSPMDITVNGEPLFCTDKRNMQKQLEEEYLDVPRQIMEMLCVISFDNFNSLSQMNTKTTKMFLDNVLGLDLITRYTDKAKELGREHEMTAMQARGRVSALEAERSKNQIEINEAYSGSISSIEQDIKELNDRITNITQRASTKSAEITKQRNEVLKTIGEITAAGKQLTKDINFIQQGTCPTCGAPIDQSHLDEKLKERDALRSSISIAKERDTGFVAELDKINQALNTKVQEIRSHINQKQQFKEACKEYQAARKWADERLKQLESELNKSREEYETEESRASKYVEFNEILTSRVRPKIMEGIVPVINKYCALLSNAVGMDFSPRFDSSFSCFIYRGENEVSRASLSTGQGKMVDTIIILAVLVSIARHVNCNVMLLDELMSNLDNQSRSKLLFTIKEYMKDKTVLIVSHQEVDHNLLDGIVKVARDGDNKSKIEILSGEEF